MHKARFFAIRDHGKFNTKLSYLLDIPSKRILHWFNTRSVLPLSLLDFRPRTIHHTLSYFSENSHEMKFNLVAWNEIKGKVNFKYMQILLHQIWNNLSKPFFPNYQKALKITAEEDIRKKRIGLVRYAEGRPFLYNFTFRVIKLLINYACRVICVIFFPSSYFYGLRSRMCFYYAGYFFNLLGHSRQQFRKRQIKNCVIIDSTFECILEAVILFVLRHFTF